MPLHIIKLVVGVDTLDELLAWRRARAHAEPEWVVHTRVTPKRAAEVEDGGSIYRVIKGVIVCRQPILRVETHGEGRASRCRLVVAPEVVRVAPTPRRPFQGWRYLEADKAPPDLDGGDGGLQHLPADLAIKLRELGAW
jgi:hypothetical protein